jgi:hypothetical protein
MNRSGSGGQILQMHSEQCSHPSEAASLAAIFETLVEVFVTDLHPWVFNRQIRFLTLGTCHWPPLLVVLPCVVSAAAMACKLVAPVARMSPFAVHRIQRQADDSKSTLE